MNSDYNSIVKKIEKLHKRRKELNKLEDLLYEEISKI